MVKIKIELKKILLLGLIGLALIIASEIFRILSLKVLGLIILAVVFVINSTLLVKRIEKLENGNR
ncbi:hypothetical protein ES703_62455 [subsurface metagenome]